MQRKFLDYQRSLERSFLSANTVKVYLTAVYTYYNIYKEISSKSLDDYKKYLETHYNPRSANLHIIGSSNPQINLTIRNVREMRD